MNICERVMAESDGRITDVCIHLYYKLFDIKLLTLKITIMKKRLLAVVMCALMAGTTFTGFKDGRMPYVRGLMKLV